MQQIAQRSWLGTLLSGRFELPEWGKLKMAESGRFTMPYAMLAIMVSLLAIVLGAFVTIGLALAGGTIWMVMTLTEVKTTVANMSQEQQTQRQSIDAWKAYVNRETNEVVMMREKLPPRTRAEMEQWRRDNPNPRPQN
jgi:hypothetical protein